MSSNIDWRKILFLCVAALTLATFVPLLGVLVPMLELFAHFKVHYIVASLFLMLSAMKMRRPAIAVAALVLAAVNATAVMPSLISTSVAAGTTNIKLITLNMKKENLASDSAIDFLRRENADIVVLEEVTPRSALMVKTLADVYPHMQFCENTGSCEMALLSKKPWRSAEIRNFSKRDPSITIARYALNGFHFTLVGTHLDRPTLPIREKREHFHHQHVETLIALLRRLEGPLVVAGDFNAAQWSPSFKSIIEGTGLSRVEGGILPTWPAPFTAVGIPIDQILTTAEFKGSTMITGPHVNSDHLPLIATLVIK